MNLIKIKVDSYLIQNDIELILKKIEEETHQNLFKDKRFRGENLMLTCPFHADGHENHPSCGILLENNSLADAGDYNCFTCGAKGHFYQFVAKCFGKSDDFGKS